jgi:HEPN domain-containing protein
MHVPQAERAARWRAYAQGDREAAERLAVDLWHVACFHAQQASEKALKALLTRIQGDAVPTHLAHVLLQALDRYYIPTRYPDALNFADATLVYSTKDARQAIEWADTVLSWCDERIAAQPD